MSSRRVTPASSLGRRGAPGFDRLVPLNYFGAGVYIEGELWYSGTTTTKGHTMKLDNLIERLEAIRDRHDEGGELDVIVAIQPAWPLALELERLTLDSERDVHDVFADETDEGDDEETPDVLWLVTGSGPFDRSPYAPRDLFESV